MVQTLDLKADGTFVWDLHTRVMMNLDQTARGRYRVVGSSLRLDGTAHSRMDDGYKKSERDEPFGVALRIDPAGLVLREDEPGNYSLLRKVADGPPPVPQRPKANPSDPSAVALVQKVERRYASLKSYVDEGTVKSNGEGFQTAQASFSTRFVRPNGFLFTADYLAPYHGPTKAAVWKESGRSWLAESDSARPEPRPLGNGLSVLAVDAGQEAELIPTLLMPDVLGVRSLSGYPEVHASPDEKVGASRCAVLRFWKDRQPELTLWVDRATLLVRRARYRYADEEIVLKPRANVPVPPRELLPAASLRRRRG